MISTLFVRSTVLVSFALAFSGLTGCATMSQFNGYVKADAGARQAIEAGQYNAQATAQVAIVQNPDINGGKISPQALKKIEQFSISCQEQIDGQLAGAAQSAANGAMPYGAAGLGAGPAAAAAFSGAKAIDYAKYGGITYLFAGAANGLVTGSYAMASAKGTCTRDFWDDVSKNDPAFRGTHVEVVYAGKRWHDSVPPALDHSAMSRAPKALEH